MKERQRKIYGVGVNDADYQVEKKVKFVDGSAVKYKTLWLCPYFSRWRNMISRCYNPSYQKENQSYVGCSVTEPWRTFSTFKIWMEAQDWVGKVLDKDLLVLNNKVYGPDTCVFISETVNNFLTERKAGRGIFPLGVSFHKRLEKYQARCSDLQGKNIHLGYFLTPEEAHLAWLNCKFQLAKTLAENEKDERVKYALLNRYVNFI